MNEIINANIKNANKNWLVDISGEYVRLIKDYLLNDGISEEGVRSIISNSAKILGYCPNPNSNQKEQITGLMIGKVQSGKTSSFISLIAAAFDNEYNIVVVLGGTKNELLKQNKNRIREYFNDSDAVVLSVVEDVDQINESEIMNFIDLEKKVIIVALKHHKRIDDLRKGLFSSPLINNQPILIIDDEGDEHTPNTAFKKNKESTKYKAIKKLRNTCNKAAFISVTATPQANIIMPIVDVLSPDFAVLVKPGEGYCGLDVFHEVNSEYCIEIPDTEESILDNKGLPTSFLDALSMFFVSAAIYHSRTNKKKKYSMLIHPSRKVDDLSFVKELTMKKIQEWREMLLNPDDIGCQYLRSRLKKAFDSYKNSGVQVKDFDVLFNQILYELRNCGVHLITGRNHLEGQDKNYANNIYVGGEMVGRGLTFKGLAITYIIRSAKGVSSVDTVQQRARWFGYKMEYIDLCRVFATKKILNEFEDIKQHEEDLWQTINAHNLHGRNFKDMKRIFMLSDKLRLTRTSVGKTEKYDLNLWNCEDQFIENQYYQNMNMDVVNQIEKDFDDLVKYERFGKDVVNKTIRDLSFDLIVKKYLSNFHSPLNAKIDTAFIQKINNYFNNNKINARCDIVWPRYDLKNNCQKLQEIKIDSDGRIHNYMVGQRPNGVPKEQALYKGDRYIVRGDVIEIQFHNILNTLTNETSLCIALYVPPNYNVENIVVGE